jgi:hypothetical protein
MPLQQTSGNDTSDAYGGGAAVVPTYIEDVFSTYLWDGNNTARSITNGIDLAGKGGMVWIKNRPGGFPTVSFTTNQTPNYRLNLPTTQAQLFTAETLTAFNSDGFSLGTDTSLAYVNYTGYTYCGWTFRKQPKFFDVVTFTASTGTNTNLRVSHNLGSAPGCIIVKSTTNTNSWYVYHKSLGINNFLILNRTDASSSYTPSWGTSNPTSTDFGFNEVLFCAAVPETFVAYLYADNAGGFGAAGTDNVITCGSFNTDSNGYANITLGYEPAWVMYKVTDTTGGWGMGDVMRGMPANTLTAGTGGNTQRLFANTSAAETTETNYVCNVTSTGFAFHSGGYPSNTFIYIAIRRGPMKTPTDATTVFLPQTRTGNNTASTLVTGPSWPLDMLWISRRTGGGAGTGGFADVDRLRGAGYNNPNSALLLPSSTDGEYTGASAQGFNGASGDQYKYILPSGAGANGLVNASGVTYIDYMFQRAPGFFDEVCYTGNATIGRTVNHNLGVAPELLIVKGRSAILSGYDWYVYTSPTGNANTLYLNLTSGSTSTGAWNSTTPTSTTFTLDNTSPVNRNGSDYVSYLFASVSGVSKVGSYTGNGTTQTINCGFAGGARFVLIKRTDAAGDWYVYDTARGMTTLTDPYLFLNSTAAESATLGSVTTVTTGFAVNASILAAINTSAATYIFLAIA